MKPEEIYRSLSLLLVNETDVTFISEMVKILNGILLTATEVFQLRNQLRTLDSQVLFHIGIGMTGESLNIFVQVCCFLSAFTIRRNETAAKIL